MFLFFLFFLYLVISCGIRNSPFSVIKSPVRLHKWSFEEERAIVEFVGLAKMIRNMPFQATFNGQLSEQIMNSGEILLIISNKAFAHLNWQSLEERRIINDLTMSCKINSNFVNISFAAEISLGFQGTRRSHDCKFMPLSASY